MLRRLSKRKRIMHKMANCLAVVNAEAVHLSGLILPQGKESCDAIVTASAMLVKLFEELRDADDD